MHRGEQHHGGAEILRPQARPRDDGPTTADRNEQQGGREAGAAIQPPAAAEGVEQAHARQQ
jgi:hypothetical protein